jgi:hypothetical protein
MCKRLQMAFMAIALLLGLTATTALGQSNTTEAASKMSSKQMMDKMSHMSTDEKAAMFDKMTNREKREAMKMAGHDMSKMSTKERMDTMSKLSTQDKADMFDKMPMDTKMATMKMAMKHEGAKAQK